MGRSPDEGGSPELMSAGDELLAWSLLQEEQKQRQAQMAANDDADMAALLRSVTAETPDVKDALPDIVLHAGGCAFGLHMRMLAVRCPSLYAWLLEVRHHPLTLPSGVGLDTSNFSLRLLHMDEEEKEPEPAIGDEEAKARPCPMRTVAMATSLAYARCIAPQHERVRSESSTASASEEDERVAPSAKRFRRDVASDTENERHNQQWIPQQQRRRRARNLFGTEKSIQSKSRRSRSESAEDGSVAYRRYGARHVELVGVESLAVVPVVEYIYTKKVRLLHDNSAWQTAQLAQWLAMDNRLRYKCLRVAIRQVTPATWMDMMLAASSINDEPLRRVLRKQLGNFMDSLEILQYQEATDNIETDKLRRLKDHELLVHTVSLLHNNVRMMAFWQKLCRGLERQLFEYFELLDMPSLYTMSRFFAPNWEPYMDLPLLECCEEPNRPKLATVFTFGEFVFQVRVDILAAIPLMWRIIKCTSPKFQQEDEEVLENSKTLADDPEFWLVGILKVKYRRAPLDGYVVTEEAKIKYQHTRNQYGKWNRLVWPAQARMGQNPLHFAVDEGFEDFEDLENNYYRKTVARLEGKFFVWGDAICSQYHRLLQDTLFYCAPLDAAPETAELATISEMKRLPVDTLVMVLLGDYLSIPWGEKTLLRCLNKMVFGLDFPNAGATDAQSKWFNGSAEDVDKLYRCVRWCFVPLEDIITTLRRSPRQLKFYELILEGLKSTPRRFHRRLPMGWHRTRDAYIKNETNVSEFTIEAGDEELSPEYFTADGVTKPRAVYAHADESLVVTSDATRSRSA